MSEQSQSATPVGNLAIWQQVEQTNPDNTKEFNRAGGFKGTAINQTYQTKRATALFGPIGIGWGFEEEEHSIDPGAPGESVWNCKVRLWYVWQGVRGEVVQRGATTYVGKNKYGAFTDEEAGKKSITDAVSKCLSLLGFSADVYLGFYDDDKYVNDMRQKFRGHGDANGRRNERRRQGAGEAGGSTTSNAEPRDTEQKGAGANAQASAGQRTTDKGSGVYDSASTAVKMAETVNRLNELRRKIREKGRGLSEEQITQLDKEIDAKLKTFSKPAPQQEPSTAAAGY